MRYLHDFVRTRLHRNAAGAGLRMKAKRLFMDGNAAAAEAMRLARVQVVAAYPITPQSPIAEGLAKACVQGTLNARYMRVESEHSAMSCCIGAALTGVRVGTATASVGLALMHEMLGVASGLRVPIVMPVVNRSLAAPWSLWCDHTDAMAERDTGWLQFYAEDPQETLDLTLIAYRIAEHQDVLLPAMVCLDGFFVSHTGAAVMVPEQSDVDDFVRPYQALNLVLDPDAPMFVNPLTMSDEYTEIKYQQNVGADNAESVVEQVMAEYADRFGREYQPTEFYRCEDAEEVVITLGSMSGTAAYTVDRLRGQGEKVGLAKIVSFRPFPHRLLRERLAGVRRVGVLERATSMGGAGGPVLAEVRSSLANLPVRVGGFVAGLGGRDIPPATFERVFRLLRTEQQQCRPTWVDVRPDAMTIREVVQQ
jgi:pyruvate ferredoxin oxidoreductase alpha subunit